MRHETNNSIDWRQVVVNLEIQLELQGYHYGLYHDLVLARAECERSQSCTK